MRLVLVIFFFFSFYSLKAQPGNYWSMGSNTEASMLAGAVVGGGSGITSIFYNPAGISELLSNKISLDASLFHFNLYTYDNGFGQNDFVDYLDYEVQPRFFSFVLHPKERPNFSFQFAIFSRGVSLVKLSDFRETEVIEPITNIRKKYSTQFDYENRYADYWFGLGGAYQINDKLVLGVSILGSAKSFLYFRNSNINLESAVDSIIVPKSNWSSYNRQDLYVVSVIAKIGANYSIGRWTYGLNISLPSWRLYGDGYHRREISMTNIYDNGVLMPDELVSEQNNHIVANFKEPFSIAGGLTYLSISGKTRYFFSTEYFASVDTYNAIDNSRVASFYEEEFTSGTDFLTYKYGAESVINAGVGIKHSISESFSILGGFKTDFTHYKVDKTGDFRDLGQYQQAHANLYHLTSGVQFKWNRSTILLGIEYTYGRAQNIMQFADYDYPGVYDPNFVFALQDYPSKSADYTFNGLGIYLGLSLDF